VAEGEIVAETLHDAKTGARSVRIVSAPLVAQISYPLLEHLSLHGLDVWLTPDVVYTVIELLPHTVRVALKEDRRVHPGA
jgi:hypothetical protein